MSGTHWAIKTYLLRTETDTIYRPFPKVVFTGWRKVLAVPVNWILAALGAQQYVTKSEIKTVILQRENLTTMLRDYVHAFVKQTGKYPTLAIIGREQMAKAGIEPGCLTMPMRIEKAPVRYGHNVIGQLNGIDIILHPWIDGVLPLCEE